MNAATLLPRLGISPLSWVNEVLDDLGRGTTAHTCLSEAASAGYAGVELSKIFPKTADTLLPLLQEHGLQLATGWYNGFLAERSVPEELQAVTSHAALLAACGCKVLVYGECARMPDNALDIGMSARLQLRNEEWSAYGARLSQFAQQVQQRWGLALSYHHHLMMVAETLDEVRQLMAHTRAEDVGLLLDTGHAYAAGYDYRVLITEFGARINHIQLKDVRANVMADVRARNLSFNQGVRNGMFTIPGDGALDFAALAEFVRSGAYRGAWLVVEAEQDPQQAPPLATVIRAFHFVQHNILS